MSEDSGAWLRPGVGSRRGGVRGQSQGGGPRMHRLGGTTEVTGTQSTGGTGERTLQGGPPAERRRAVPPAPSIAG